MNRHDNPAGFSVRTLPAKCLGYSTRVAGFSYVEVLVAVALIAIALVPAMDALQSGTTGVETHVSGTDLHYHLTGKLEDLLAEPFSALDDEAVSVGSPTVATRYSDDAGAAKRRLVFLSRYDADNADGDADFFTGGDTNLVWVRVEIEGTKQAIESLTSIYE